MTFQMTPQLKTGLFVLIVLIILAYATIRISQTSFFPGRTYTIYLLVDSATGLTQKTPVEIAGIQVGTVKEISLVDNHKARLALEIQKKYKISREAKARVRTVGFLGDTYIEIDQAGAVTQTVKSGDYLQTAETAGDINSVTNQISDIASDIKAISTTMRQLMAGENSSFAVTLRNIEKITESLKNVTTTNEGNLNAIIVNMREISTNLNRLVARNQAQVDATLDNIAVVTGKVRDGEGSLGRLINSDETVEKLNESLDNLNNLLGTSNKWQVELGYHAEYLGTTEDFKNYISFALKPRPDKYFLFELVNDPSPDATTTESQTTITSGGVTSVVDEKVKTTEQDKFRFSAQFAKKFYDFTLRAGIIESSGGAGIDYNRGPVGLQFSAFDFETKEGEKPHLKTMATLNLTESIYLLGGLDDFLSNQQDPDWFMGAGVQFTDEDIKSILGLLSAKP